MSRNQLDNAALEALRDIADDVTESDFVPYACLTDPHTLLTKNGEVLQIIKITGFTFEAIERDDADLRQVIRRAVASNIDSDAYALWFTTIRRKKNLSPDGAFPDGFSAALHEAWKQRNGWDRKYINELYVTIVREGQPAAITSAKDFVHGLRTKRDVQKRNAFIDESALQLNKMVEALLGDLESFGARRLTSVKREDGLYYGEHLEFLEKLINLEERPMPLAEIGLSDYLTSGEITFAYNAMEVRSAEGERRFGAMITVKEYKEASRYRIDDLLHLPCEFIATQCLSFTRSDQARKALKEQYDLLRISGELELAELTELSEFLQSGGRDDTLSYGEQQTTLFAIAGSMAELENSVEKLRSGLANIGIVSVREDIHFEDCYWAMLPANFAFLKRLNFINVQHIAGFANLQNYPAGNAVGCPWGPPVTVFYTAAGTPYFFNFHAGESGHTLLVGPYGSGKSVLLNFLLSESRKYQSRLFYLDAHGHAGAFIRAIGGHYYALRTGGESPAISPISLADSPSNREFLALWITTLIHPEGEGIDPQALAIFKNAVAQFYALPADQRRLGDLLVPLAQQLPQFAPALARWHGQGEWARLFDHAAEAVAPQKGIIGFDLSALMSSPDCLAPLSAYLLHRMTMTFDGAPSVLVLDEAWKLLGNPLFAQRSGQWLDYIASKNGVVIMTSEAVEEAASYPYCNELVSRAVTQIYLPEEDPSEAYAEVFGLNEDECAYLEAMSVEYRHFMLKRRSETIIAELNLGGMDELLAVLSGSASATMSTASEMPRHSANPEAHHGDVA